MAARRARFIQPAEGIVVLTHRLPALNPVETSRVLTAIRPMFGDTTRRYDVRKYPTEAYSSVKAAFKSSVVASPKAIRAALIWKYGHSRKEGAIPAAHERLIREVQQTWPGLALALPAHGREAFAAVSKALGGRPRFITAAFLTHLARPQHVPIVDQHNYRAVNSLIRAVRADWTSKKAPSQWTDIELIWSFMNDLLSAWRRAEGAAAPDMQQLDRFLMVHGKDIKARHNKR